MTGFRIAIELLSRTPQSARVHCLRFKARVPFRWAAGQYLIVVRASGRDVSFPYSIASAFDAERPLEFELAVAFRAGADAIDELRVGEELEIEGPFGDFTWHTAPGTAALLVGTGTGIAPLRALLQEALARETTGPVW